MRTPNWVWGVLATASCGFPRPPDVGPDDAGSTDCQLVAIEPSVANTGDVITLEGTFVDTVTVNFPGGTSAPATVLGRHRARVNVPAAATEGDLTVTTCGSTVGPLPFRRASFTLGLGTFAANVEQSAGARQAPRLVTARARQTSAVVGHSLYLLGGAGRDGALNSIEQAAINADGSLGPFSTKAGISLVIARQAHTSVVIGKENYVLGGIGDGPLDSIEHASISSDGSLGSFMVDPGVTLTTARYGHTSAVVGNYLYVLGGLGAGPLNSVERAVIGADGSLGPFAIVPGVTLATARYGHAAAVVGNYLYVFGGAGNSGSLEDVERATINADGSLGPFAAVSSAFLTTPRSGHTVQMLGDYLYVFYGDVSGSGALNSIERAPVDVDGTLGSFEPVPGVTTTLASRGHTTAVIGNYLYFFGGANDFGFLDRGEQAPIDISGSLGPFVSTSQITLATARAGHSATVIGSYVYVFGGSSQTTVDGNMTSIERATVNGDGSLGLFTPVPGVTLSTARSGHATAVIGDCLYVLGGSASSGTLNSIERATINADGSLGVFVPVQGVTLATARSNHAAVVVGDSLYVIGGQNSSGPLGDIEQAAINADGSLGPFATLPSTDLVTGRAQYASAVVGDYLYVFGGTSSTTLELDTVERADIHNGLTTFDTVSGLTITATRGLNVAVVGGALYVLGGTPSILERAAINADSSLGAFGTSAAGSLVTSRFLPATVVIKNAVYVLGGFFGRAPVNTIESAPLR